MNKRRKYRVNADMWTVLQDLLTATPDEFNADSATLRGRIFPKGQRAFRGSTGIMSAKEHDRMHDSVVNYVIYSYDTPIAYRRVADWNADGTANYEWIVPDYRYSVTTSKHQGKVRTALSQITGGYNNG